MLLTGVACPNKQYCKADLYIYNVIKLLLTISNLNYFYSAYGPIYSLHRVSKSDK